MPFRVNGGAGNRQCHDSTVIAADVAPLMIPTRNVRRFSRIGSSKRQRVMIPYAASIFKVFCRRFMALTLDDVRRVAHLARIAVDDDEALAALGQLEAIFKLIGQMQAVDTTACEPMSHPQDVVAPLRDDAVTEPNQRELFQSVAPEVERGLYLVPRVIE